MPISYGSTARNVDEQTDVSAPNNKSSWVVHGQSLQAVSYSRYHYMDNLLLPQRFGWEAFVPSLPLLVVLRTLEDKLRAMVCTHNRFRF